MTPMWWHVYADDNRAGEWMDADGGYWAVYVRGRRGYTLFVG